MGFYNIEPEENDILRVGFDEPAGNDKIVIAAEQKLQELIDSKALKGGKLLKINGPASMPVAMLLGHKLVHLYETIACFDPKLASYVVISSHGDTYKLGDLIE